VGSTLALALASLALGAGDLQLETGVYLEGRGRILSPRDGPDDRIAESVVVPRLALGWIGPDLRVGASYAPRLRAPDLLGSADLVILHAADLRAGIRLAPAWQLSATARGERGTTDLITESRQAGTDIQTITTTARLRYQAARGDLRLAGRVDPRTTLSVVAGAFVEGGAGAASEAMLPIQRGLRGEAGLSWAATRLDRVGLRLSALGARLDRGPTSALATVETTWRRRLARELDAWIFAGATGAYEDPRGLTANRSVFSSAEIGIAHTPPAPQATSGEEGAPRRETPAPRIASQATVRLSPSIDRATGAVDPQLEGTLRAQWPVTPRWSLGAGAVAAVVRQAPGDSRRGRLEAQVAWAMNPKVRFGTGVYGSWQRGSTPALPSFSEGGVYLSVDLDAPKLQP
jgi:hypothetical protein